MADQRPRRGPRGGITAEFLARAAQEVLNSDGLEGMSLRAIARRAEVTPTVIYTYFHDMAALRNRVGDDFLGQLDLAVLGVGPPAEALRRFLVDVLAHFAAAPGQVALLASQRIAGEHSLALNEALLDFFVDRVGHTLSRAAAATALLVEWVHGASLLGPTAPVTPTFQRALSRLDPAQFPRTAAAFELPEDEVAVDLLVHAVTAVGQPAPRGGAG